MADALIDARFGRPVGCVGGKVQMMSHLVLGIDEAGRGPALGPMVLAAVVSDEKAADLLAKQGVRDPKHLVRQ